MEVIGTTPGKEEVEQRQEQLSRVESGTETESNAWSPYRGILLLDNDRATRFLPLVEMTRVCHLKEKFNTTALNQE